MNDKKEIATTETLDAYFIRIEIKLEAEISVSLLALHVLYTGEKKSVCILERPSPLESLFSTAICSETSKCGLIDQSPEVIKQ